MKKECIEEELSVCYCAKITRILYICAPGVSLKATQLPPGLGAVELKGLVLAHTEQPLLVRDELDSPDTPSVCCRERGGGDGGEDLHHRPPLMCTLYPEVEGTPVYVHVCMNKFTHLS